MSSTDSTPESGAMKSSWKSGLILVFIVLLVCGSAVLWLVNKHRAADQKRVAEAANARRVRAEQGDPKAESELAYMYSHGQGVPQDYSEALRWVVNPPTKVTPLVKLVWPICICTVRECRRTTPRLLAGIARLLTVVTHMLKTTLASFMKREAWCSRTTPRLCAGTGKPSTRTILPLNTIWATCITTDMECHGTSLKPTVGTTKQPPKETSIRNEFWASEGGALAH